ncbi:hypothetical protein [Candidatus Protochlamydia sp. W-9]|uniref:hypothetical protein n=1 Tax=Candidatus Protochlamydia sp. W-9 TaxID=1785087 RepID=UPI00096AB827|nr:hypothetical protein [Candidatus Protochlamydia sp. W-9]
MPVYLNNTDFEFELANPRQMISQNWEQYPLCQQLQFIPLLYACSDDVIAVSTFPSDQFLCYLRNLSWRKNQPLAKLVNWQDKCAFKKQVGRVWGASQQTQIWAEEREIYYHFPINWEMIREINSKAYSFKYTTLSKAALIENFVQLEKWFEQVKGEKVLKSCFGLSGKGNLLIKQSTLTPATLNFCEKEWKAGRVIIAEPWLERFFDFSSQWVIHSNGSHELLGSTVFETDQRGMYLGTLAGDEKKLFKNFFKELSEHYHFVQRVLDDLFKKGFFGNVGIDAFLYQSGAKIHLYPVVEINARQTMSLVALRLQRKWFPNQTIRLRFASLQDLQPSLLPLEIFKEQETIPYQFFKRKLVLDVI